MALPQAIHNLRAASTCASREAGHRKLVIHLQGRRLLVVKFIEFDVRQEHRTLRGTTAGFFQTQG